MDLINLFVEFQKWNSSLVDDMRNCFHHAESKKEFINPYHMCNDTWTHTCLAYRHFLNIIGNDCYDECYYYTGIAILCHDIGKIYTREIKKNGNVSFYSHSFASVQDSIDFIHYLNKKGLIKDIEKAIYFVTNMVSNHIDFHREESLLAKWDYANHNNDLFTANILLNVCDDHGRIGYNHNNILTYKDFCEYLLSCKNLLEKIKRSFKEKNKKVVFMVGFPGAGKNTFLENDSYASFDDIRVETYLENNNEKFSDEKEIYKKAFHYCNDNNIDLNGKLIKQIKSIFKDKDIVYVNNLNLTRKSRRVIINSLNKYEYDFEAIILTNNTSCLVNRNRKRKDKEISFRLINKMMKNFQVPTYKEGISNIRVVYNGDH